MIRPRRLRPGDRIALVAPASAFRPEDLDAGIAELGRLGFEAVVNDATFARATFEAGAPDLRARVLHEAWCDPSIAAIIAIRGGYGSQQLLPLLDPAVARAARKLLIGYSDITALLLWLFHAGVVSVHGPMVEGRLAAGPLAYDRDSFLRATTSDAPLGSLGVDGVEALAPGDTFGVTVGGTLTQIASLLGTPWALDVPRGAILLLEDVNERPYRIHRMLTQLRQAGVLGRAGALVFGEFPGCAEAGGSPCARDVVRDFAAGFTGPVLFGLPFGHTSRPALSIPIGVRARVSSSPAALIIEEPAVS